MKTMFKRIAAVAALTGLLGFGATASAAEIIQAHLEAPNPSELASGIGNVQGWAFATVPGDEIKAQIEVWIDGQFAFEVPCCSSRGDVVDAFKNSQTPAPLRSGFAGAFNFQSLAKGEHTMEVRLESKFGHVRTLKTTFTSEPMGNFAYNKKFLFDDATADHCVPSNVMVAGESVARLVCSGMTFTNGKGFTEHCAGKIEMTWIRSAQGFRLTKGCDLIDWVKPPVPFPEVPAFPGGGN